MFGLLPLVGYYAILLCTEALLCQVGAEPGVTECSNCKVGMFADRPGYLTGSRCFAGTYAEEVRSRVRLKCPSN
jgi:hypothetical protein